MSDLNLENLNPEQKKAVTYGQGPLLIVAGAGTGKTTVITQRVAWLIAQSKAKGDEILAVTFTDKAASEMEERVDRLMPMGYLDLWISTFHAFCQRMLQAHAVDIGLPGDFKLLDQTAQWLLVRQNLDKFNLDYYRPLGNPTKFIQALLKHFSRAKDEAVGPEEYLAYVQNLKLDLDIAESTGGKSKVRKSQTLNSKSETNSNIKIQNSRLKDNSTMEALNNGTMDADETFRLEEVANGYHTYQQILLENNALDFGDLINYTLRLFQKRPKILEQYRQQFKYILVDEFQDTNWAQYELIKLLAAPKNNLTVVADDDQSIYKFRGASVSNVAQFNQDFPKAEVVSISTNYRSRQKILDVGYKFIQLNNPNRLEAQNLDGKKINKQLKAHYKGKGEIEYLLYADQYDEAFGVVQKILDIYKSSHPELVSGSKGKTLKHPPAGRAGVQGDGEAVTFNDFAILIRANSQADNFITALEHANVSYQYVASRGLYSKPIILDIINFLKLLDDYHESPSLWRVLNWPIWSINPQTLVGLNHQARKKAMSLYQTLHWWSRQGKIDKVERAEMKKIIALVEQHTKLTQHKKPREVILSFLEDSGYLKWLVSQEDHMAGQQLQYLDQFDSKLKEFESQTTAPTVKSLLADLQFELEAGETGALKNDTEAGPEGVKLLTIHAAKGLEFKYVFLTNLVDKRFPAITRRDPIELPDDLVKEEIPEGDIHLQEERRLMYVAITRAKDKLFLTAAKDYGGKSKKKPSRFLYELNLVGRESEIKDIEKVEMPKKTELPINNYQLPSRFSYTQLKSFENCPYQYRFAHILKVPIRANYTLSFGKTMHATLKRFIEHFKAAVEHGQGNLFYVQGTKSTDHKDEHKIPELKELLKIYEAEWIDDWYESAEHKAEYRAKGKQILKEFHAKVKQDPPSVYYLEQGFNLKIQDPKTKKIYAFFGVIDRVDKVDDKAVEIIDYKTGSVKNEKTIEKDQLLIYQIATEEVLKLKPRKLTFYYLNENKPVSFLGTREELEKMKKKILDFARQVQESDFRATPSPHTCKYCDYRNICEFRRI